MDTRKSQYKHKPESVKSLRERRRKQGEALRKAKREKLLSSKRIRQTSLTGVDEITELQVKEACSALAKKPESRGELLIFLKKAFTQGSAFIDAFLGEENAMTTLVSIFTGSDEKLQLEAAWCLTNIATGAEEHALSILKHAGAYLITFLSSGNGPLEDQCLWTVGNIAANGDKCHDMLKDLGVVAPLVKLLSSETSSVVQSAAFALSNMARGTPTHGNVIVNEYDVSTHHLRALVTYWCRVCCLSVRLVDNYTPKELVDSGAIPPLVKHLEYDEEKLKVLAEVSWVLAYLSASGDYEDALLEAGTLEKLDSVLIQLAKDHPNDFEVLTPLLRCLGNICCGLRDVSARACKNKDLVPALGNLLQSEHRHIKKECLWVLSNITADPDVCQQVIDAGILSSVIELLKSAFDIKRQAAYSLCNIACHGEAMSTVLLNKGALQVAVPLLKNHDQDTVELALNFCHLMLTNDKKSLEVFLDSGGLEGLEGLEYHSAENVQSLAKQILETFIYPEQEKEEKEKEKEKKKENGEGGEGDA